MEDKPVTPPLKWWQRKPARGEVALALFLLAILTAMIAVMLFVAHTMGDRILLNQ